MKLPRNAQIWLPGYLRSRLEDRRRPPVERVWIAIADHYEPLWAGVDETVGKERVGRWSEDWPQIASRHADSAGRSPQYTFFYPEDEYRPFFLDPLADMTRQGVGDVEIHIHHDDGAGGAAGRQRFIDRMEGFIETLLHRHGLLRQEAGRTVFGFIHGNWALDNSRPDGKWCGINDEIQLLARMGCYADFTMPSGSSPTQARTVNRIYWATDDPRRPKSYDYGPVVQQGREAKGDLLMIPGPFGLRWAERLVPRMEAGELAQYDPPTPYRIQRWLDLAPRIGGDCFIKLFTHGAQERNSKMLLGGGLDDMFRGLSEASRVGGWSLHYVTAWEMYRAVRTAWMGGSKGARPGNGEVNLEVRKQ